VNGYHVHESCPTHKWLSCVRVMLGNASKLQDDGDRDDRDDRDTPFEALGIETIGIRLSKPHVDRHGPSG